MLRFPYDIYHPIVGNQLVVVAYMHAARHPLRWQSWQ